MSDPYRVETSASESYERDKRKTVVKDSSFCSIREAKRFADERATEHVNRLRKELVEPRLDQFARATNEAAEKMELAAASVTQVLSALSREITALQLRVEALEDETAYLRSRTFAARWARFVNWFFSIHTLPLPETNVTDEDDTEKESHDREQLDAFDAAERNSLPDVLADHGRRTRAEDPLPESARSDVAR